MWSPIGVLCAIALCVHGDYLHSENRPRGQATLKPLSACCDIPELGDSKPLTECSNPKATAPCNDVKCVFEKSKWLNGSGNSQTLNKEAFKAHLRSWASKRQDWSEAVEKAITDCVDKDIRQYLEVPCIAYDVFTCSSIAMLKKCPKEAWKC